MSKHGYDYDNINMTELIEIARQHGFYSAHRGLDRSLIIAVIEGEVDSGDCPKDPIDDDRNGMMIMKEEWPEVHNQLKCGGEFHACWDCPAARAYDCAGVQCEPDILNKVREGEDPEDADEEA